MHFHVVPRMPDLAKELRGPRVFTLLGRPEHQSADAATMDEFALTLRQLI